MIKNKIKISLLIISILIITFFHGGNKEVNKLSPEEIGKDLGVVEDISISIDEIENNEEDKTIKTDDLNKENEDKIETSDEETQKEKNKIEEEILDKKSIKKESKENVNGTELKAQIIAEDEKNKDRKDKYLTDPVPEGKPKPVEWQEVKINKEKELTATVSVTCKSILNNMHLFNEDKLEVLPENGIIYETQEVTFYEGESVFDVLLREMQNNKIHMEFVMTPVYNSNYVEGINNLYEFDCGELSGWMYRVNGWFPNYGSSRYLLQNGDKIEWIYTCDLGRDIGGEWAVTGGSEE